MNQKKELYHFIGIGGIGMSALARILLEKQLAVSGSDLNPSAITEALIHQGANIKLGNAAENIPPHATVVYSTDIKKTNPEFQAALNLQCKLLHRSELLAHLMQGYKTLAVAGTHGKTTTSSLLATIFQCAGKDPSFALGGMVNGKNGKSGAGDYFIAEADESDGTFLNYKPYGAIVTNIEAEHLDHYGSEKCLIEAFHTFIQKIENPELFFFCKDDPILNSLCEKKGVSYGFKEGSDLQITEFKQEGWKCQFALSFQGKKYNAIELNLIGEHNALNAAAAFGLALKLGIAEEKIREGLALFSGVNRRCEKKGECREVLLLDDYAHHPTEVKKTLDAIREAVKERRLIVIFQPHRYTRLRDHLHSFASCFEAADQVFVTDIYNAREEPIAGVSSEKLVEEIKKRSTVLCSYVPKDLLLSKIHQEARPHDVIVTMGAGDITRFHDHLNERFRSHPPKKFTLGLIFGGRSCEHEISIRSSRFINSSLNRELYEVRYFGIDKEGNWVHGETAYDYLQNATFIPSKNSEPLLSSNIVRALGECELFFPVLHGPYGEDGTLQGFLEMLGKPYAGPGYRGAAICMDKILTKKLVSEAGVPTPKYVAFGAWEWRKNPSFYLDQIEKLSFPLFVKPSHAGSSVGITKVESPEKLQEAICYAFRYDMSILVEEGIVGCRELEFAVMGNHPGEIKVPSPGEKLAEGTFVDYAKKYGQNAVKTTIQSDLSQEVLAKGKEYARLAYEAVGNSGMTRVDFLLDPKGNFWFFEMNPIPGLQPLSLFPKIWNREGVPGNKLADHLVILGLERNREQNRHLNTL